MDRIQAIWIKRIWVSETKKRSTFCSSNLYNFNKNAMKEFKRFQVQSSIDFKKYGHEVGSESTKWSKLGSWYLILVKVLEKGLGDSK